MVSLRLQDVRPHGRVLNRVVLEKHSTKSGTSRTVAINKQATRNLEVYIDSRGEFEDEGPLFPSQKSLKGPMSSYNAIKILDKMFREAGVANASSHSLRRTHANTLRRQGADLMIIKEQLGHTSLSTTQRYFDADPVEVQAAVDRIKF